MLEKVEPVKIKMHSKVSEVTNTDCQPSWREWNRRFYIFILGLAWWAHQESNLGPPGYEPGALTN